MATDTAVDRMIAWFKNNKYFAIVLVAVVALAGVARVVDSVDDIVSKGRKLFSHQTDSTTTRSGRDSSAPSFAKVVMSFGDSGIGPGMFTDARAIALDGDGNIYVAEYLGNGRIQRFDSTGRYVSEWRAARAKQQIFGIAADRQGFVYVATGDSVVKYRGSTGVRVRSFGYSPGFSNSPEDVRVAADGSLVTAWRSDSDDVVIFDGDGKRRRRVGAALSSRTDESSPTLHVAVDGTGNVYVISHYGDVVLKYSPEGRFLNQFGSDGMEPGQFHRLLSIAVDGKGRVYAADMNGVQVFTAEGRFLRRIESAPWSMGMALNDEGYLFTVSHNKVRKYRLTE